MKLFGLFLLFVSAPAFAGSCRGALKCTTASGMVEVEISYRLYDNELGCAEGFDPDTGKSFTLRMLGRKVDDADFHLGWDGDDVIAFELGLAPQGQVARQLSAEIRKKTLRGTLRYKTRAEEPGSWRTEKKEALRCEEE